MGHWTWRWMGFKLDEVEEACPFEIGNDFVERDWIILQSRWMVEGNFIFLALGGEGGAGELSA